MLNRDILFPRFQDLGVGRSHRRAGWGWGERILRQDLNLLKGGGSALHLIQRSPLKRW